MDAVFDGVFKVVFDLLYWVWIGLIVIFFIANILSDIFSPKDSKDL